MSEGAGRSVALPGFLAAFQFRDFRRLWSGAFVSSIGTWTQDVALSWLIHTRMGEPFFLGLRAFAAEFPLLAFMLVGGAVADRVDRRKILLTSQVLQMTFAAALAVLFYLDRLGIGAILLIAFLTGLAQSQSAPTYQAVLTSIGPPAHIPNAVALNSLQFNLSRAIGPAIAGLLLASAGTGPCFAVNALSFVAVILAIRGLHLPPPPQAAGSAGLTLSQSLGEGVAHVRRSPELFGLTLLALLGSFLAFPLITYLPVLAGDVLKTGAAGYSLLLSSFGGGAIVGAVLTAQRGKVPGRGRLMLATFAGFSVLAGVALFVSWQPLVMALLFGAGGMLVTAYSTLNSLVQELAPDALRGRVLSAFGLAFRGGGPLGGLVAGALVGPLGLRVVLGAYCALLGVIALGLLRRGHRLAAL
ncbi:MAG: MFS transporter [Vicinamibacteria bacterium]|nr:MFS transporter [Vicinamibacteria bacterium]